VQGGLDVLSQLFNCLYVDQECVDMPYELLRGERRSAVRHALDRGLREPTDWRVERILHFVNTHDGKLGWDLNRLCAQLELGISGSHAAKLFSRHTGIGVREYAKRLRLTLAAHQILNTTDSVKRIAFNLGYRTPDDLRRQFKMLFCLTPSQVRAARRLAIVSKRNGKLPGHANVIPFGGGKA
jgi:AraC-like DNA-binding protein